MCSYVHSRKQHRFFLLHEPGDDYVSMDVGMTKCLATKTELLRILLMLEIWSEPIACGEGSMNSMSPYTACTPQNLQFDPS